MHENEMRMILGAKLEPSRIIDEKVEEAYRMIRSAEVGQSGRKPSVIKKLIVGIGSAAAVFALMVTFCVMNPVLAGEIPVLGGVFSRIADLFSFGRLPEEDTVALFQGSTDTLAVQGGEHEAASYQQTSGDLTITLTEEYATNQAVFIGVHVKNAQEFPEMALFMDGTQMLSAETTEHYSFLQDAVQALRQIEGTFADAHTFEGILRIDYTDISADAIPETFTMKLDIAKIVGDLAEPLPVEGQKSGEELERMSDEEWEAYMKTLPQEWYDYPNRYQNWWQEGSWSYDVTVTQKDSASRVIELNQTNEAGIGIRSIELSAVEMTLNPIEGDDTIAVVLDADGTKIENGSSNVYELAVAGHDISKVYIYICDYDAYMNEIKGYNIPGNQLGRSFQEVLEERALFRTVVETGE